MFENIRIDILIALYFAAPPKGMQRKWNKVNKVENVKCIQEDCNSTFVKHAEHLKVLIIYFK